METAASLHADRSSGKTAYRIVVRRALWAVVVIWAAGVSVAHSDTPAGSVRLRFHDLSMAAPASGGPAAPGETVATDTVATKQPISAATVEPNALPAVAGEDRPTAGLPPQRGTSPVRTDSPDDPKGPAGEAFVSSPGQPNASVLSAPSAAQTAPLRTGGPSELQQRPGTDESKRVLLRLGTSSTITLIPLPHDEAWGPGSARPVQQIGIRDTPTATKDAGPTQSAFQPHASSPERGFAIAQDDVKQGFAIAQDGFVQTGPMVSPVPSANAGVAESKTAKTSTRFIKADTPLPGSGEAVPTAGQFPECWAPGAVPWRTQLAVKPPKNDSAAPQPVGSLHGRPENDTPGVKERPAAAQGTLIHAGPLVLEIPRPNPGAAPSQSENVRAVVGVVPDPLISAGTEAVPTAGQRPEATDSHAVPVAKALPVQIAIRPETPAAAPRSQSAASTPSVLVLKEVTKGEKQRSVPRTTPAEQSPVQSFTATADRQHMGQFEVIDQAEEFTVAMRRSKLLRTQTGIHRAVVVDPGICDVVQFTPQEVLIVGKGQGATHVTFWFEDGRQGPATYLVRVTPDPEHQREREQQCAAVERRLAGLFPNRNIRLVPAGDMVLLKGDARDVREAARILEATRGLVFAPGAETGLRDVAVDARSSGRTERQEGGPLPPPQVVNLIQIASAR